MISAPSAPPQAPASVGTSAQPRPNSPAARVLAKLERVLTHDGVCAVYDRRAGGPSNFLGDERYREVVDQGVALRRTAGTDQLRVMVGDVVILHSHRRDHEVAIVFERGHPVVKSVVRMTRQLLGQRAAARTTGSYAAVDAD